MVCNSDMPWSFSHLRLRISICISGRSLLLSRAKRSSGFFVDNGLSRPTVSYCFGNILGFTVIQRH